VRALAVAIPLNAALLAGTAKALFGELSWVEAFLVGFVLSPTDPVTSSSVVTSAKVPVRVRNILNLESGLNDGLALPFVLLFLELSTGEAGSVLEATGSLGLETVLGLAAGVVLALAAGGLLGRLPDWALENARPPRRGCRVRLALDRRLVSENGIPGRGARYRMARATHGSDRGLVGGVLDHRELGGGHPQRPGRYRESKCHTARVLPPRNAFPAQPAPHSEVLDFAHHRDPGDRILEVLAGLVAPGRHGQAKTGTDRAIRDRRRCPLAKAALPAPAGP